MGLTEAHQVLSMNNLRERVTLRTDGGLRTGRDVVMAAMLGAEEYGIGTAALIAMGCIMVRQCQSNTCPVGVCTQDTALRAKFTGTADKVVNLITFYAQEVREILAQIGARSMDEIIGRADLLSQVSRGSAHLDDLDLNPLLITVDGAQKITYDRSKPRNHVPDTLDAEIVKDGARFFEDGEKMQLSYAVRNTLRTIGTRASSHIVKKFGMRNNLQPDHLTVKLHGSCGQSLGAFAVNGLKLEVQGDANDYVGKGLSGGTIVVRPQMSSPLKAEDNTIIGNTVLYGATAGYLFASGRAGERFAVRNSGASVVVEGCGSNGCEYMTGGVAVILGQNRRQLWRGHDRRHGLCLRSQRRGRGFRQRRNRPHLRRRPSALGGATAPSDRTTRQRNRLAHRRPHLGRLGDRTRQLPANLPERDAAPLGTSAVG